MKLAIYVHYDKTGTVHDYVLKCLNGLLTVVDEIVVVVNGELSSEGKERLLSVLNTEVLQRPNTGFDFHAWKEALELVGWDHLPKYDSILLTNNTYYGPIYPYTEMWDIMEHKDCDFWGISKHPAIDCNFIQNDPNTKVLEHIQSYWVVFKNSILKNNSFKEFWKNIPEMQNFQTAVGYGELALTKFFEAKGFKSSSFLDVKKYASILNSNPCLLTDSLVIEDRCPVAKRKFFYDYDGAYPQNGVPYNYRAKRLFDFLKNNNLYDTDCIFDDLLQIAPLEVLSQKLMFNFTQSYGQNCNKSSFEYDTKHIQEQRSEKFFEKSVIIFDINNIEFFMYARERIKKLSKRCNVLLLVKDEKLKLNVLKETPDESTSPDYQDNIKVLSTVQEIITLNKDKYAYVGYFSTELFNNSKNNYQNAVSYDWSIDNFCGYGEKIEFVENIFNSNLALGILKIHKPSLIQRNSDFLQNYWCRTSIFIEIFKKGIFTEYSVFKLLNQKNYIYGIISSDYQTYLLNNTKNERMKSMLANSHSLAHDVIVNSIMIKKNVRKINLYRIIMGLHLVSNFSMAKKIYKYAKRILQLIRGRL